MVVVIDDAHLADLASLRGLVDGLDAVRGLPLLVVLSYREVELDHEAAELLDGSASAGPVIRLEGLGDDDTRALITAELGAEPSPALVAAVQRLTGGTPGFVRETVARLGPAETGDEPFSSLVVPEGLRDLLERRMARLADGDAEVVRIVAVLGDPVDEAVLAAATGLTRAQVAASLAAAARLHLVARDDDGRWRFTSSIFGRVLAAQVPERHRARYHRRAADHLEALIGSRQGPGADALAEHLLAGPRGQHHPYRPLGRRRRGRGRAARRRRPRRGVVPDGRSTRSAPTRRRGAGSCSGRRRRGGSEAAT